MKWLAEQPNLFVKISGQGTFLHRVDAAFIAGVVHDCVALCGSERCMFGSNLPIEKIWSDAATLFAAYAEVLAGFSEVDRENIMGKTAARVYRI